jgi:hypothetical protein
MRARSAAMHVALSAQSISVNAAAQRADSIDRRGVHRDTATTYRNVSGLRLISSAGGAFIGLFAGGFVGAQVPAHNCGCDDPGLEEVVYGALVGATIGAAIGTALPNMRSICSTNARFGKALLGAAIGASAGFVVGGGLGKDGTALLLTPAGAIGGSLFALGQCWRSRLT